LEVVQASEFAGKMFVVRVDEATASDERATLIDDLHVLADRSVRPVVVAPDPPTARAIVRTINRSANIAIALSGSDAALLPSAPGGIGNVQTRILETLTGAGFIPVVEPTAFALFEDDETPVLADDVAAAIATACNAFRAIFFHQAGGVPDPDTARLIAELTPAEALDLAGDERVPLDLRTAIRAAALGVRGGLPQAQIVDGRIAHAAVIELLTMQRLGTRVTGRVVLAG
jgi:acetylglutamate kinase